ncbi:hypothetical protein M9458_002665, partial [Cirrhinus mrigala]
LHFEFATMDDGRLIEEVEKHRQLYDPQDPCYKDPRKKEASLCHLQQQQRASAASGTVLVCKDTENEQHYQAADSEPAASTVPHPESRILRPLVFRDNASCCSEDRITPLSKCH